MLRALSALICAAFVYGNAAAQDAGALRARHAALQEKLSGNPFGRSLHVDSSGSGNAHRGEVYAVLEQPFDAVAPALARPAGWCEILILQMNVKRCDASSDAFTAFITRKARDALDSAYRVAFRHARAPAGTEYLNVAVTAAEGPLGTRDYQIVLEAAPLDSRRTFIHLSYAYTLGLMARLATDAYLAGAGRDKLGFSVVERLPDGRPVYVGGVRGMVERGAVRHYLAVETYLESLARPAGERVEWRLLNWYAQTERYPQLREPISRDEYLEMKRKEAG